MDSKKLEEMLSFVIPGTALREGLNNILEAGLGALIVVGFDENVKKIRKAWPGQPCFFYGKNTEFVIH